MTPSRSKDLAVQIWQDSGLEQEHVSLHGEWTQDRSGSYKDRSKAKEVKHFTDLDCRERCVVVVLKYGIRRYYEIKDCTSVIVRNLSKLPLEVLEKTDGKFYFRPQELASLL